MYSIKNLPTHVGIIMDGNGRWAIKRHLPRLAGHKRGVDAIRRIISASEEFGIKILTFFAFSTENWKRDKEEVYGIFDIVRNYLKTSGDEINASNIKLSVMGDYKKLPEDLAEKITEMIETTKNNTGLVLNLAINYGARDELVRAFNLLAKEGKTVVTAEDIEKNLYSYSLPDPDLIIRTSGEKRLSNFMLYQIAYAELYFSNVFWPSFSKRHLKKALVNYSKRERRYGGNHK